MIELAGRRVLVTGASRGIGAACARRFAAAGAAVAVHYRESAEAANELLAELEAPADGRHLEVAADLSEPGGVDHLFEAVEAAWGRLDVLVLNAGVWHHDPVGGVTAERLAATWHINLRAPFLCVARSLPLLERSDDASIINIASTAGQRGEAEHSPYAASKGALIAAARSWAVELAPEIRVNTVAPGWVDTEMCAGVFAGGGRERIEAAIPLGRVATADDIAGPVVFLASALSRHMTGAVLSVNGGTVLA